MNLRAFFTLPALLMFVLGVFLSGTVMAWAHRVRGQVAG